MNLSLPRFGRFARARAERVRQGTRDDRRRTVTTAEGLPLTLVLASRGARAGALALDLIAQLACLVAAIYVASAMADGLRGLKQAGSGGAGEALEIAATIAVFVLHNGWFLFFELGPRGATPGKRLLGLRVIGREGQRLTAEMVIARNLLRDLEVTLPIGAAVVALVDNESRTAWAIAALFGLVALFPLFNAERLRAGDLVAGTWVIETGRRRRAAALSLAREAAPASGAYAFTPADLAIYGEKELQTLERVLREGRAQTMTEVAEAIAARIGWTPPGSDTAREFLDAYYAALRARLEQGLRFGRRKPDRHSAER